MQQQILSISLKPNFNPNTLGSHGYLGIFQSLKMRILMRRKKNFQYLLSEISIQILWALKGLIPFAKKKRSF